VLINFFERFDLSVFEIYLLSLTNQTLEFMRGSVNEYIIYLYYVDKIIRCIDRVNRYRDNRLNSD